MVKLVDTSVLETDDVKIIEVRVFLAAPFL